MKVNFSGPLAEKLDAKQIEVVVDSSPVTVGEVIDQIVGRYPEAMPYLRNDLGDIPNGVMLVVNEEIMPRRADLEVQVTDSLSVIPAISGG